MTAAAPLRLMPVSAETGQPLALAMQRLWLSGRVLAAGARLIVTHLFRSEERKPVEVVYSFALPRDAALRRFRISGEGFSVHSELRPREDAIREYEKGIEQGSLATMACVHGDGVTNLTVGNLRPAETVTVQLEILAGVENHNKGFRFRFPFTLAPAYHPRARTIEAEPGIGEMELPEDEFGDVILPRFARDAAGLHRVGFALRVEAGRELAEVASPSHRVSVRIDSNTRTSVSLAGERDVPDRDLVLDVQAREEKAEVMGGPRQGKGQFVALIPSSAFGENPRTRRRVVVLLDRSGSMGGAPIDQARKAIQACLGALAPEDEFGLVAFDDSIERLGSGLVAGTKENREAAGQFLAKIAAGGGTELAMGVDAAATLLGGGGDVLVLTDGQVAGTEQILAKARQAQVRLHCLGIGSASQDRFLALLARETGGVSRFVTARERVDLAAVDLFASVGGPLASGISIAGAAIDPQPASRVFAGTPLVLYGQADSAEGALEVAWDGGRLRLPFVLSDARLAETVWLLQGARLITDVESRYGTGESEDKRTGKRVKAKLRLLSETYGLASREMSLVAVIARAGDKPGEIPKTMVVPVGMAEDTRFGAYFGEPLLARMAPRAAPATGLFAPAHEPLFSGPSIQASAAGTLETADRGILARLRRPKSPRETTAQGEGSDPADVLLEIAASLEPDGGMPGRTAEDRALSSALALLAFLNEGHTPSSGAFRRHAERLAAYLEKVSPGLPEPERAIVALVLGRVGDALPVPGEWLTAWRHPKGDWQSLGEALASPEGRAPH
ncbi:MAG: VIT domain-containing protein [Bryobacteraceae bacterium]